MWVFITKTCLYNFDPLKPHFYIVKLGFTGVYIIFLISARTHWLWDSLEPPRPQSMFWAEIWKISEFFIWKFWFFEGKIFSCLNRHVFVMQSNFEWHLPWTCINFTLGPEPSTTIKQTKKKKKKKKKNKNKTTTKKLTPKTTKQKPQDDVISFIFIVIGYKCK